MADKKSFRKSQLIALDHVAAGHDGMLSDPSGEIVVKPCKQSEIDFYESTLAHPALLPHIPTYMGRISLGADTTVAQAAGTLILPGEIVPDLTPAAPGLISATLIEKAWAPSDGKKIQTDLAVLLENVAAGYKKPNILDVKLGARLWADDAPIAKRARLDKTAEETTSKPLGFRIAGMKIYQGADTDGVGADSYRPYDKTYGRSFNVATVPQGFREYFSLSKTENPQGPIKKVIRRFIGDLEAMAHVLSNEESRMYSASLLFVHEGDREALRDAFAVEKDMIASLEAAAAAAGNVGVEEEEEDDDDEGAVKFPAIQSLRLIDFAHAQWTPGLGPDENVLHGIRNVARILGGVVE